jgi:AbrB family looped-hinge helix DNA binding protein
MEIILEVSTHHVKGHEYFRLNIPSEIAKKLDLKEGDKIRVDISSVMKKEGEK